MSTVFYVKVIKDLANRSYGLGHFGWNRNAIMHEESLNTAWDLGITGSITADFAMLDIVCNKATSIEPVVYVLDIASCSL